MKLEITAIGPDGSLRRLQGEALPRFDRPAIPSGLEVELAADDLARLQAGILRLRRAHVANQAVGSFQMDFSVPGGFEAKAPINELPLKVLALEARPFFLNDDPIYFPALVKLQSFAQFPDLARGFRMHTKRWRASAFNGTMGITIGGHALDVDTVVSTWFNSDLFHTQLQKPEELSLKELIQMLGGESIAQTLLAAHLTASLGVVNEFFQDVMAVNKPFRAWVEAILAP